MILPGIVEIKGQKLYWGKGVGIWIVSDLPNMNMGHCLWSNSERHGLRETIDLFLKELPWGERVRLYAKSASIARKKGWPQIAEHYENILNENYNVHTRPRKSI